MDHFRAFVIVEVGDDMPKEIQVRFCEHRWQFFYWFVHYCPDCYIRFIRFLVNSLILYGEKRRRMRFWLFHIRKRFFWVESDGNLRPNQLSCALQRHLSTLYRRISYNFLIIWGKKSIGLYQFEPFLGLTSLLIIFEYWCNANRNLPSLDLNAQKLLMKR